MYSKYHSCCWFDGHIKKYGESFFMNLSQINCFLIGQSHYAASQSPNAHGTIN